MRNTAAVHLLNIHVEHQTNSPQDSVVGTAPSTPQPTVSPVLIPMCHMSSMPVLSPGNWAPVPTCSFHLLPDHRASLLGSRLAWCLLEPSSQCSQIFQ